MDETTQRLAVFGIELFLAYALITWMRAGQRGEREPWSFIFKILSFGALTAIISAIVQMKYSFRIEQIENSRFDVWLQLLNGFSASLIEEMGKYMIGVFSLLSTRHVHKMSDTVLYLIIVGLGFSLVEDAIYLANPETVPALRLMSFYLHSGTSAIIGYSLGRYKFGLGGHKELLRAVTGAVGLHFAFNLATVISNPTASLALTFGIALFVTLQIFILFRRTLVEEYGIELRAKQVSHTTLLNTGHLAK